MKYLNLTACRRYLPMIDIEEKINGTRPTLKISAGEI
jgi:hypothetical protein